ncbi:MAG: SET domain-containing protein [Verrucomicrobiae bacterium]|nr:SET domain-containing protein [Verrucomicrobiae bacterium]MCP5538728.1 SET domain-containing protein [Akkermansiaceae bacterium]MCP5549483.1 SET domain-containing protein [Akkermansiaceae bacterium]
MIHPDTAVRFVSEEIGHGVVATAFIPRGTVTWVRDRLDREFSPAEVAAFDAAHREILDRYSFRNAGGHYVFCWDHTRFMNHSYRPTCLPTAHGVEVAVRDVEEGEELTNDYGCFNIVEPFTPHGETDPLGRAEVAPDDLVRHAGVWDAEVEAALRFFSAVRQPLAALIDPGTLELLNGVAAGRTTLRSVAENFFPDIRSGSPL